MIAMDGGRLWSLYTYKPYISYTTNALTQTMTNPNNDMQSPMTTTSEQYILPTPTIPVV